MPTYGIHPDCNLRRYFSGYQGQYPRDASIIFVGYDANWPEGIAGCPAFYKAVLEYLISPLAWLRLYPKPFSTTGTPLHTPIHHPLLNESNCMKKTGNGVPYHRNINKLHFTIKALEMLSFLELLRWPTVGNTGGSLDLILDPANRSHLEWINSLFCCCLETERPKLFIIPRGMLKILAKIGRNAGLPGFTDIAKLLRKPSTEPVRFRCNDFIALTHLAGSANPKARIEEDIPRLRDIIETMFGSDMFTD